jgi:hypothetical protein
MNVVGEVRAGELDDVMLNADIPCCLPAQKIICQFLKKWKCLSSLFSVETFFHLVSPGLHLFRFYSEGADDSEKHFQVENQQDGHFA